MAFGLSSVGAKIVDTEKRGGDERTLTIIATGLTERAAKRSARFEAAPAVPLTQQDVELVQTEKTTRFTPNRYTIRITRK